MTAPRFSIVTPCLNRATTIGAAIDSVLAQGHPSFEHIIVDGGSTDGTAEVLARYPHLTVIREADRNLYDAINKGLRSVHGEIVGLLNSDDLFAPGAFAAAEAGFTDPAVEMVLGAAEFFSEQDGREVVQQLLTGAANDLAEANVIGGITTMNAAFYHRTLIERVGPFDDRFPLSADKDFWLRLVLLAPRLARTEATIIRYRSHAGSLTFAAGDLREKLSRHNLATARTRLPETPPGSAARAAYRRWHGWATGYRMLVQARQGALGPALATMRAGFAADMAWLARFLAVLPGHWRGRATRRGAV
ncbi:glycosyltransferase [Roseomonas sp. CAU 1739]|uniref:glycosyltransferase n=1 Tax=Roseomonas sp. CAU 1739 TaxID=3140364 RepID=UPI00325B0315